MTMINPSLVNFDVVFSDTAFPEFMTQKYNKYLRHINAPFKTIDAVILESIQNISVPGISLQTLAINALSNLGNNPRPPEGNRDGSFPHSSTNFHQPGTAPISEIYDNTIVTITYRNNIFNWLYFMELCLGYYKRTRTNDVFSIKVNMRDSAKIALFQFNFADCFVSGVPGLEFSTNAQFNETKTIDVSYTFSRCDFDVTIPEFNVTDSIILK